MGAVERYLAAVGGRNEDDETMNAAIKAMKARKPIQMGDVVTNIGEAYKSKGGGWKGVGNAALVGLADLLNYANTAQGHGYLAGMTGNADRARYFLGSAEQKRGQEAAEKRGEQDFLGKLAQIREESMGQKESATTTGLAHIIASEEQGAQRSTAQAAEAKAAADKAAADKSSADKEAEEKAKQETVKQNLGTLDTLYNNGKGPISPQDYIKAKAIIQAGGQVDLTKGGLFRKPKITPTAGTTKSGTKWSTAQ